MTNAPFKTLGEKVTKFTGFDAFPTHETLKSVVFQIDDFASVCPVTGQPDFSSVTITLHPNGIGLETKTLKLYLETYRDKGIFCEDLATTILADLTVALNPIYLEVIVSQHVRGGIGTTATASVGWSTVRGELDVKGVFK